MADNPSDSILQLESLLDRSDERMRALTRSADLFAGTMARAFSQSVVSGKSFDDVLKSLALRMSDLALRAAFKPIESALSGGIQSLVGGLFGGSAGGGGLAAAMGAVKPFATGGIIGTPTYFPLSGGIGLAGEAGPEAIMPLTRGPDGRLGVASASATATSITVNIMTPDVESFRRSEAYVAGQIARAAARGQRSL